MRALIAVSLVLMLASCGPNCAYQKMEAIKNAEWHMDSTFVHEVQLTDSSQAYNIKLELRHRTDYLNSNFFLFMRSTFPSGKTRQDTIECMLAQPSGKWLGNGLGDMKTISIIYRDRVSFKTSGTYKFELAHAMREETLVGISDIGISICEN